jgi:hypothetical protein
MNTYRQERCGSNLRISALFTVAPSQKVLTIRFNPETQQRSLDALQWGLIPYWAKDPKIAYKTINCTRGNGRYGTFVPAGLQKTALPDSSGRILRMEEGRRRQSFFRFPEGNRFDAPELQVRRRDRWLKIIHKMWMDRTLYDPELHHRNQLQHGSWIFQLKEC